ncbi:MAG: trimeric intracellular cation channel family protein [Planctomycetota bacterium]
MLTLLDIGDLLGTFVFAITGAIAAAEKRLDFGGFLILAFITAVGGGTIRDVLLDRGGVFWADRPQYLGLCALAALLVFFAGSRVGKLRNTLLWGDAFGLALFSVIGAGIALEAGAGTVMAIMMGVLTCCGGGILREVIRNEVPIILQRDIYISAALAGSTTFVLLMGAGLPALVSGLIGGVVTFGLRAAGIVWKLSLPVYGGTRGPGAIA